MLKHKLVYLLIILVLSLSMTSSAFGQVVDAPLAQSAVDSYIVIMSADPAIAYQGEISGYQATKPGKGQKINPNSARVRKYTQFLEKSHIQVLQGAGVPTTSMVNQYSIALNGFSLLATPEQVAEIEKQKGVLMVMKDELRQITTDSSPDFLGLTDSAGPYARRVNGEGVIVGVIDTGIWPEHPSFADNRAYRRLPLTLSNSPFSACDFGNSAHNPNDAPFTCNNKLIGARQMLATYRAVIGAAPDEYDSARDDNGHGSHTASTAAGNAGVQATVLGIPRGEISGIAPRARLIAYKALGNQGGFTSDLAAAIDQAVEDGVDVINYSIGGGASLIGADDLAFLFAADAGVFVAVSAGNSGPGPGTIGGPASVPWVTSVGASTQARFFQGTVELGNGAQYTGASITPGVGVSPLVDGAAAGSAICQPGLLNSVLVTGAIVLCQRGVIARVAKSDAVLQAGGVGMIMYENSDTGNLFSDSHWVPSVHVDNTPGLAIKAYIASDPSPTARIVGEQLSTWPYAPSMTDFSSRGPDPVALDIIKPDVTAPGLQILAGNSPTPDAGTVTGELFQAIAGTSMSSPHVAGIFALLKQEHRDWSAAMAKSALMTSAYQEVLENDRLTPASPFSMGAGHVDPGGKAGKNSLFEPGLAYEAGFFEYLGFLCDAEPDVFVDPAGTCAYLAGLGIPTEATNLNLASIGVSNLAGAVTVQRTVTSVAKENSWRTYNVSVQAPAGYSVSVTPSTLTLRRGMSANYEVTITNQTAPVGEWRFGSLTWSDTTGHYDVYSPIAVRAAEFDAPAELQGSGASGSLSFDILFGYTGTYTAAPHGLVLDVPTLDTVSQDADQDFDPLDVGTGGANAHVFNLAGAAHFRVTIPPSSTEANADLDVYVYDPSNNLVASSTLGGTDEQVDISLPADGAWTVYVHGWQTVGADSDYTLHSWVVPLVSGGSLVLDSSPASAVIGTTGTISVSWSALASGEYLGAVSHTGPFGLLGFTLVNVSVP
ncbi:MAG: hypothetical protein A2Z16_07090 [Chloroflexi bacterium RBG_16_54_18]|nr:MAG: hypothetical protein A2Z16_07090 [Chloroflexi bacterium RBG_16_54_18]